MNEYVVPGRVELVGKHVDYAGGRSLTCAVDLTLRFRAEPLDEPILRVTDRRRRQTLVMPLGAEAQPTPLPWSPYVASVARRLARDWPQIRRGCDVSLVSDLPAAAGLSSSSALVIGLALALLDANDVRATRDWNATIPDTLSLAEYLGAVESGGAFGPLLADDGVGTRGGAQDHVAILCNEPATVGQFAYRPATLERRVPWPADMAILVCASGVHASKTGNARASYNRASDAMRMLASAWNAEMGRDEETAAAILALGSDAADQLARTARSVADRHPALGDVPARLAQFRGETEEIVPQAAEALARSDLDAFARVIARSQSLAESALGNQVPETIFLAREAVASGAVAASAFGAGFGGAVWAMVPHGAVGEIVPGLRRRYAEAFPMAAKHAQYLITRPGRPARARGDTPT